VAHPRAFRTWLFQATRHRAIDHLRRRRRERILLADAASESEPAVEDAEPEVRDLSGLADAMAGMTPAHREVLLLRYEDDLSYAEIALVTGCSVGTVRSRLHHAKRRLVELTGRDP
jgi:RNA polymerase sigma-70 factor (ECF subfamily)